MKKFIILPLLLIVLLSACAPAATQVPVAAITEVSIEAPAETTEPIQAQPTEASSSPSLFQIVKPDGTEFDVTLQAVKALPLATLSAEGKVEEGPYLSDVLDLAGVTEFTEVTLSGSSNPATLTFAQVDKNTILDFNNHGTMKLSTTYIPKANWTKDVAEFVVK
jgi:hypothetical protein